MPLETRENINLFFKNPWYNGKMSGRKSPYRFIFYSVIFAIIAATMILKRAAPIVSPIPESNPWEGILSLFQTKKDPEVLKKKILDEAGSTWSNYSFFVKGINSDFTLSINSSVIFTGASVNKLAILAALYALASKGDVDLTKTITLQESDIQDYGTGSIRYDQPGTSYTVKTLARLMCQKSDNTAAYILGRQVIGFPKIQDLINSWGLTQTDMEKNETSNADMALLMEKIYKGKITSPPLTQEMLSFLTDTDIEDRISGLLPPGTLVYHKTGNGIGYVHDIGIVKAPKTTYYIGILTSDVKDEKTTSQKIATLSRITYDFLR